MTGYLELPETVIARQRDIPVPKAEALVKAARPLWLALEDVGFVDAHGGAEFDRIFPDVIDAIHRLANPPLLEAG
jgi:CelD/BcsL family acetyltransferase involved in cellulose biosynthesis